MRIFCISFLVFQCLFTVAALLAQVDVILAVLFLPNPQDSDGIVLMAPIAGWVFVEVVLSPITALAAIALDAQSRADRQWRTEQRTVP